MTKRTYGGPLIDVAGAVDLHCHPYPDLFPRLADDFDIVRAARDAGMKAIVLKCHHENTVSRAYLVQRVIPGIQVFGGIGYTWEHDLHLFLRRMTMNGLLFGQSDWHRERICQMNGL